MTTSWLVCEIICALLEISFEVIVSVGMDESVGLVEKLFSSSRFSGVEGMIYLIKFSEGGWNEKSVSAEDEKTTMCEVISVDIYG